LPKREEDRALSGIAEMSATDAAQLVAEVGKVRALLPRLRSRRLSQTRQASERTAEEPASTRKSAKPKQVSPPAQRRGMTKAELVKRLAESNPHLYQRDVEIIVTAIFDEITRALSRGDRVELRGFGAFSVRRRISSGRSAVQSTAQTLFRPGKELRESLN
jgi:integration host factor subunit beta